MPESIDLTTDRVMDFWRHVTVYERAIGKVPWWQSDGDTYAYTNVSPRRPTVTHFRAPVAGGLVQVQSLDGRWHDTRTSVEFTYNGIAPRDDGDDYMYRVTRTETR